MTSFPSDRSFVPPRHRSHPCSPCAADERADDLLINGVTVRPDRPSVELHGELGARDRERRDHVFVRRAPQTQAVIDHPQLAVLGHAADPTNPASRQRQAQLARGVAVRIEREAGGDLLQLAVERGKERAGEARAMRGNTELGMRARP